MKRPTWSSAFILGAVWGFLEGTWFFLVPDVLLSYIAIASFRRAAWRLSAWSWGRWRPLACFMGCSAWTREPLPSGSNDSGRLFPASAPPCWSGRLVTSKPTERAAYSGDRNPGSPFASSSSKPINCEFRWLESWCGRLRPGSNESCSRPSSLPERTLRLAEPPERCFRCARTARSIGCS